MASNSSKRRYESLTDVLFFGRLISNFIPIISVHRQSYLVHGPEMSYDEASDGILGKADFNFPLDLVGPTV